MKAPLLFILLGLFFSTTALAQSVNGKWVGKLSQTPGGYRQLYDFELNLNQKKNISGESYAYIKDTLYARLGVMGRIDGDSIRLKEDREWIIQEKIPDDWILCIKNINLAYRKIGDREYLQGMWNGVSKYDDQDLCLPGLVILARNQADITYFLDSVNTTIPAPTNPDPIPIFTETFNSTTTSKIKEIEVHNINLQLQLRDYLNVDDDSVSIFVNRKPIARGLRISKKAIKLDFKLDSRLITNEILIYAENLGKIPPNTSEMIIIDGNVKHEVHIVSDKQKTAAIYLKYIPR